MRGSNRLLMSWAALLTALVGLVAGGGIVWVVRLIGAVALRREAMGFGDVTLMAMVGAFVGWQASLIVFFMTFNLVAQFKAGSEILNTLLQDVPQFKAVSDETRLVVSEPFSDLPGAWNEYMDRFLGITPSNNRDGVLQDITYVSRQHQPIDKSDSDAGGKSFFQGSEHPTGLRPMD